MCPWVLQKVASPKKMMYPGLALMFLPRGWHLEQKLEEKILQCYVLILRSKGDLWTKPKIPI